ncbi:MAG: efflux RND transporter permease subunit, partial [Stenotrophobium sp.]
MKKPTGWTLRILRLVEPPIFRWRAITLPLLILATLLLCWQASMLRPDAGWLKMVPKHHPYMQTFLKYYKDFGGANTVLVSLEEKNGDIYQPKFMEALRKVTDDVFFVPGVDRSRVTSLFTPNIIYADVVEGGLAGETVVPSDYTPTPAMMRRIRSNVGKADVIGRLVSEDQKSAMIVAELLDTDPLTNQPLDYARVGEKLEAIRHKYETPELKVRIIGFAKVVDDMTRASVEVGGFFFIALIMMGLL